MATATPPSTRLAWPDHRDLPDSDGAIVENFQEHPQSLMLTDSLLPQGQRTLNSLDFKGKTELLPSSDDFFL